jgi:hypothetical protein
MAADVVTLADAVQGVLAAFDWGEPATVVREWLDVNDLKALQTLHVLVTPESDVSSPLVRERDRHELRIEIVVQKRVGPTANKAAIDAIVAKIAAARDALRQPLAGAYPLTPEWPVIASPEHLHEAGVLFSVLLMRWAKQ